jgi:hypothetical protein
MRLLIQWLVLCCTASAVTASVGDRSAAYRQCKSVCQQGCADGSHGQLSLPLRFTFWTCQDECSYQCMHNLTDLALASDVNQQYKIQAMSGLPPNRVVQFHGKWPFYRFLGIQEPLSVLFSAGNLYMHVKYGISMRRRLPKDLPKPLQTGLSWLPIAGINLWIWSIIFHTRDKAWTEKLDYFSAALSMLCNLYYAAVRLGGLYPAHITDERTSQNFAFVRRLLVWLFGAIFLCHISYLSIWRFDYSYNMAFNITIGLLHNLAWVIWSLRQMFLPSSSNKRASRLSLAGGTTYSARAPHYLRPLAVLILLSSLTALELFDFPPFFRSLDAHALWHASTIPVIKWWYDCLVEDAWWLCGRSDSYGTLKARLDR